MYCGLLAFKYCVAYYAIKYPKNQVRLYIKNICFIYQLYSLVHKNNHLDFLVCPRSEAIFYTCRNYLLYYFPHQKLCIFKRVSTYIFKNLYVDLKYEVHTCIEAHNRWCIWKDAQNKYVPPYHSGINML